jgi:hypothetical protein
MEAVHGVLEWFIILAVVAAGIAVDRLVPYRRVRYPVYAALLLTAFIFDLNRVTFRYEAANAALCLSVMLIIVELVLICVRKRSRFLLVGAFALLVPVFLYACAGFLLNVSLPCHEDGGSVLSRYDGCAGKRYEVFRRLSFDPFRPARVYSLGRDIRYTPLRKEVDRFTAPDGYLEARFSTRWECAQGGCAKVDLTVNGYALWTLVDKSAVK